MSTDLRFRAALGPQPGGAVALRFAYIGEPPVVPPATTLRGTVSAPWRHAAAAGAPPPRATWRDARGAARGFSMPWARLLPVAVDARLPWGATSAAAALHDMRWRDGLALAALVAAPWRRPAVLRGPVGVRWRRAAAAAAWSAAPWQQAHALREAPRWRWAAGRPVAVLAGNPFNAGAPFAGLLQAAWRAGLPVIDYGGPWSAPGPGTPPPVTPCYTPPAGAAVALRFFQEMPAASPLYLLFSCLQRAIVRVPVRRVYMVTNTTSLVRVGSGDVIPVLGLSLSLDVDSKDIGFSASLPGAALTLIEPGSAGEPVELLATVNGTAFRLIAEAVSRERTFGQASIRVQGRGRTAVLDAPYAALESFNNAGSALTSQQLLDAALPGGWSADWGLTAWLVPAGVWSHQGTPATAAATIAAAGGGYLQPHLTDQVLRVLPRYPTAPWDWAGATVDLELPAAVTTREAIEWVEKTRYNAVYVSGVAGGGLYLVKRAGTAGDVVAQMITDPLATHVAAGRQRGLPVLADTGRQARVSLRLPVLPETGVILPGRFVGYVDGGVTRKGLVRSISLDAGFPETWQTIGVETHVD